jgi:hypothetical protein
LVEKLLVEQLQEMALKLMVFLLLQLELLIREAAIQTRPIMLLTMEQMSL